MLLCLCIDAAKITILFHYCNFIEIIMPLYLISCLTATNPDSDKGDKIVKTYKFLDTNAAIILRFEYNSLPLQRKQHYGQYGAV